MNGKDTMIFFDYKIEKRILYLIVSARISMYSDMSSEVGRDLRLIADGFEARIRRKQNQTSNEMTQQTSWPMFWPTLAALAVFFTVYMRYT